MYFILRVLSCLETRRPWLRMFLKGLIAAAFESSEPLHLLRLNGRVGALPTYRLSDMKVYNIPQCPNRRGWLFRSGFTEQISNTLPVTVCVGHGQPLVSFCSVNSSFDYDNYTERQRVRLTEICETIHCAVSVSCSLIASSQGGSELAHVFS